MYVMVVYGNLLLYAYFLNFFLSKHELSQVLRLRDEAATRAFLSWVGAFFSANKGRAQLGNQLQTALPLSMMYASDGFCLNLCAVMLMLAKPFG